MNIIEAKEKLKKDGYTWFELEEFDIDFYNILLPIKCNEKNNIKEKTTYLRADTNYNDGKFYSQIKDDFHTFEEATNQKNKILDAIYKKDLQNSQLWFYNDASQIYDLTDLNFDKHRKYIKNIVDYFYDFDKSQSYKELSQISYYDLGCHLANHSDGTGTGRVCALLIYLNEDYDKNDGGILILNNKEEVVPKFGKTVIIDLQSFDIKHMVTKVSGGMGRYALLSFVSKIENDFINKKPNPNII